MKRDGPKRIPSMNKAKWKTHMTAQNMPMRPSPNDLTTRSRGQLNRIRLHHDRSSAADMANATAVTNANTFFVVGTCNVDGIHVNIVKHERQEEEWVERAGALRIRD